MNNAADTVTLEELAAIFDSSAARPHRPAWLEALAASADMPDLADDDVLDIASEGGAGSREAIDALIEGLRVRHQGDRVTLAALTALQTYHLPATS